MTTERKYEWDNLVAGDHPRVTRGITIANGEGELARGSVLGKVTASDEYRLSASASSDGSEDVAVILAEDVDASASAVESVAYFSGEFNEDRIILGDGHTLDAVRDPLRDLSIYLTPSVEAKEPQV